MNIGGGRLVFPAILQMVQGINATGPALAQRKLPLRLIVATSASQRATRQMSHYKGE